MAAFAAFLGFEGAAVDILMILVLNLLLDWNVGVLLNLEMGFRRAISAAILIFGGSCYRALERLRVEFGAMGVREGEDREMGFFISFADSVMESHPMEICVFE